jgi:hypothetical protein
MYIRSSRILNKDHSFLNTKCTARTKIDHDSSFEVSSQGTIVFSLNIHSKRLDCHCNLSKSLFSLCVHKKVIVSRTAVHKMVRYGIDLRKIANQLLLLIFFKIQYTCKRLLLPAHDNDYNIVQQ